MSSKLEEALDLSEDILNQLEDANIKTSAIALKCLRLARLMDDYEAVDWLVCEMEGYKSSKNGIPHDLFELGAKHGRERKSDEGNRILFTELSSELELLCESSQKSLGSYTTEGVSVAGEYSHVAMTNLLNSVTKNNTGTLNIIKDSQKKLSILRGEYYRYALNINIQLKFSDKVENIFEDYRTIVDKYLAENLPTGIRKLSSIYSRLKENDEESYSQASTSCRKLLREFADDMFQKLYPNLSDKTITLKSGKEFDITGDHYINRIYVTIDKVSINKMKKDNILQTASWIESINDRICNGLHNDVSLSEIKDTILHLYILMGDIIKGYESIRND